MAYQASLPDRRPRQKQTSPLGCRRPARRALKVQGSRNRHLYPVSLSLTPAWVNALEASQHVCFMAEAAVLQTMAVVSDGKDRLRLLADCCKVALVKAATALYAECRRALHEACRLADAANKDPARRRLALVGRVLHIGLLLPDPAAAASYGAMKLEYERLNSRLGTLQTTDRRRVKEDALEEYASEAEDASEATARAGFLSSTPPLPATAAPTELSPAAPFVPLPAHAHDSAMLQTMQGHNCPPFPALTSPPAPHTSPAPRPNPSDESDWWTLLASDPDGDTQVSRLGMQPPQLPAACQQPPAIAELQPLDGPVPTGIRLP